jgi:hypothetical protein
MDDEVLRNIELGARKGLAQMENNARPRNLTDADVDALVSKFQDRFTRQFYLDLGKGVWKVAWQALVVIVILVAAYGHFNGGK